MFERFTEAARAVVHLAHEEAAGLGHDHIGTEHLLLAVAAGEHDVAGRALRSLGLRREVLRDELVRHVRPALDADALATIGIDLDAVRRRVEAAFGPGALSRRRGRCSQPGAYTGGRLPFTPRAKKVLALSLREAHSLGQGHIGAEHILLGLIREGEGVACGMLARSGHDGEEVRRAVHDALRRAA